MNKPWPTFVEYVTRHLHGTLCEDVTYRAYDLLDRASRGRLLAALDRLSIRNSELSISIAECRQQLINRGLELSYEDVQQCLMEWYVWARIINGECRHWKHR